MVADNLIYPARIIGFAGYAGSGKTTLLTQLIPLFIAQRRTVSVIKHTHHPVTGDRQGSDTQRVLQAGASEAMLLNQTACLFNGEIIPASDANLNRSLALLQPCDIVLIEGFKTAPIPKIEVYHQPLSATLLAESDKNVLAVVSNQLLAGLDRPCFLRDDIEPLFLFLTEYLSNNE